jgi:putative flippase GtrA
VARVPRLNAQFLVYLGGGVLSALIDIGVMQLLLRNGVALLAATSLGFLAGLLFNYAFHARLTFKSHSGAAFARYLCVVALNYLLTLAVVGAAAALLGMPLLGKLASLPLVAVNGFLLGKYWIFK